MMGEVEAEKDWLHPKMFSLGSSHLWVPWVVLRRVAWEL